ncbi:sodium-coupled monocarboxylate transporter 2 [Scyliorhinus canicula]|uniref:sodium-coupled monocarboxylate transporter 2 n=1 Tax=Scyliorhinus canicula TaxID=7830 RepID=UPI0018F63693|nr:sodium-coupled monocarboxylate transporter 2 [Scyliorhinus canicula]
MSKFLNPSVDTFTVWDYLVFALLFIISAGIGVFFAIKERHRNVDTREYLSGGRRLSFGPVGLSLTTSFMSAITVLGGPAEVYRNGAAFVLFSFSYISVVIITAYVYLPIFYRSGIASTYEYLELRFNNVVRLAATVMYVLQTILYTSVVIYAPALALSQVTGFNLWGSVFATGSVCTFYCTLGGLKAVVWTDAFQLIVMVLGFFIVLIQGTISLGGSKKVMTIAAEGDRLNIFDFSTDPFRRHTFWTLVVGGTFTWLGIYGVNQSIIQRCLSCKSERHAKLALLLNLFGLWVINICAVFCGLIMYGFYAHCDPWTAGFISAPDQLMPYFVMNILSHFPGLPGLFVACVYSGTLSTVAASINALATVTYEDFVSHFFPNLTSKMSMWLSHGLCVMFGVICTAMAVLPSLMGTIIQVALSIHGMCGGPMLGLFSLGILFPCANWFGAIGGLVTGMILAFWPAIGGFIYPAPVSKRRPLSLSTSGCIPLNTSNRIFSPLLTKAQKEMYRPPLADNWYSISYLYYSAFGFLGSVGAGLIISLLSGPKYRHEVKPSLIRPVCSLICIWLEQFKKTRWYGMLHRGRPSTETDKEKQKQGDELIMKTPTEEPSPEGLRISTVYVEAQQPDSIGDAAPDEEIAVPNADSVEDTEISANVDAVKDTDL